MKWPFVFQHKNVVCQHRKRVLSEGSYGIKTIIFSLHVCQG